MLILCAFGDNVAKNRLRTRLFVNGAVNDGLTYTARLQNDQNLKITKGDETTLNQRMLLVV